MIIAVAHNYYRWAGGEDQVFAAECDLLERHGHQVVRYVKHNESIDALDPLALARSTVWSAASYDELRSLFRSRRVDVAHFHNTFPLISPAAYYAAKREGVAVVQTLHNFRLGCVNANLFRNGGVCEDCIGKAFAWPGIYHRCYRESTSASTAVAAMVAYHRMRGTWRRMVDAYVALSEASRAKLIQIGLPAEKLVVKPNPLLPEPAIGGGGGDYAIFVGRLSAEKGVEVLLAAWDRLVHAHPLKIVGDGPLMDSANAAAASNPMIEVLGGRPREEVYRLMAAARFLVLPSVVYENCPMSVVEAFASGLPAVVSGHGAMREMVEHGRTGLHVRPGDPADLARAVDWLATRPEKLQAMRAPARRQFEERYGAERNYELLLEIYERALRAARRS